MNALLDVNPSSIASTQPKQRRRQLLAIAGLSLLGPVAHGAIIKPNAWTVSPVDQRSANLCWLASSAMMLSASVKRSVGMREVADYLGDPFRSLFYDWTKSPEAGGLHIEYVPELGKRLGFEANGFASFDLPWWLEQLRFGPLMVFGVNEGGGSIGHMKVLSDLSGDDSSPHTLIATVLDPNGGVRSRQSFIDFVTFYERAASAGTVQIFSFGQYGTPFPSRPYPFG
ncbi:papain-like cysteine protease family protein [Paraburkholderia sp. DGU8]|uniref:papain-like cysteine protease family protein n=1 Tax=Paraburkholderia sp. DGU8 TaxID=3161997 RepID=UPI0034675D5B